jgi:hypothetical protein
MRLAREDEQTDKPEKPDREIVRDLLCGIGPAHIHRLCGNTFEGGLGFDPYTVGGLTLDMAFMLLADRKYLASGQGGSRMASYAAAGYADKEGRIKGVDKAGKPFKAKVHGKSLARRIRDGEVILDANGNPRT